MTIDFKCDIYSQSTKCDLKVILRRRNKEKKVVNQSGNDKENTYIRCT